MFGQRGNDDISLGDGADYGEGGPDVDAVTATPVTTTSSAAPSPRWPAPAPRPTGQPDGGDTLVGDAGEDVVLGDNGALTRPVRSGHGQPADPRTGSTPSAR